MYLLESVASLVWKKENNVQREREREPKNYEEVKYSMKAAATMTTQTH